LRAFTGLMVLLVAPHLLVADDSAASVAVGGIVLTREPLISMEKERLTIARDKVTVEFDFLNDSDKDITTEVAFPIPAYEDTEDAGGIRSLDDFKLWVDGKEVKYEVEAKAYLGRWDDKTNQKVDKKDVTAVLRRYNIDIPSLGHYLDGYGRETRVRDFDHASPEVKKNLVDLGLVDGDNEGSRPEWEVRKKYHWTQTFPAHRVVHIRHTYSPAVGFAPIPVDTFNEVGRERLIAADKKSGFDTGTAENVRNLADACVEPGLQKTIYVASGAAQEVNPDEGYVEGMWVDYILTTANSWKTPIKDFKLVIDKGTPQKDQSDYASLCWDGPVTKLDGQRYEASATDFVPRKELHILFLSVPKADQTLVGAPKTSAAPSSLRRHWRPLLVLLLVGLGTFLVLWLRRLRRPVA
jgi:hypothetical protein